MFWQCNIHGVIVFFMNMLLSSQMKLDLVNCGIDNEDKVTQGLVGLGQYPWLGILYYAFAGDGQETRSVTTVALIHKEFVLACAADVGPMPKKDFRRNSRVLLGEGWLSRGRRVRNYVLHPEYGETVNTLALIHLFEAVLLVHVKPLCPPPDRLRDPIFYVVKFQSDYNELQKEVIPVGHVPSNLCRDFYIHANLYGPKFRPPHVACAVSLDEDSPCVWGAGAALVARDVWGRWQLLGLGVRGPGCGAPARFLDMGSYYPWIENSLRKFNVFTLSKIHQHKYVMRSRGDEASNFMMRYGECDVEEQLTLQYRELIRLETDNKRFQFLNYNLTMRDTIRYDCLTLELINASASSEMRVMHICPRKPKVQNVTYNEPCHHYLTSSVDISVMVIYSGSCQFEMHAWGEVINMQLIDIQEWKWEEGTYYEDFSPASVEYRGQKYMTDFGFEPLDLTMWIPDYDSWTTTPWFNGTTTTYAPPDNYTAFLYIATAATTQPTTTTTTKRTKKYFKPKSAPATSTLTPGRRNMGPFFWP